MTKISTRGTAVRDAIANRTAFTTHGALYAVEGPSGSTGQLPEMYYLALYRTANPTYTVLSYDTPIAWYSEHEGWTVPPVKYSLTTTRHQSQVRYALAGI